MGVGNDPSFGVCELAGAHRFERLHSQLQFATTV
jgi:hypothetical protein